MVVLVDRKKKHNTTQKPHNIACLEIRLTNSNFEIDFNFAVIMGIISKKIVRKK